MTPSENTVTKLVSAYYDLIEARKAAIGRVMEETSRDRERFTDIEERYSKLKLDSPIRRSRMHDSFIKAFRKDFHNTIQEILEKISQVRKTYSTQTHRREQYGLIPPIAFCPITELSWYLGDTNVVCDFELVWDVQFQQFFIGNTDNGVLEALGTTYPGLIHWWTGRRDGMANGSRIWDDVKNLAYKMVYLLDKTNKINSEWFSLPAVLLNDFASQGSIDEIIVPALKIITQGVFRLLFKHQDENTKILPCFETLVPMVYAFLHTVHLSTQDWKEMGAKSTVFLVSYIDILIPIYEDLVVQLDAEMEIAECEKTSLASCKRSIQNKDDNSQVSCDDGKKEISVLQEQVIDHLEALGLRKLNVTLLSDSEIGSGSYARVYKCKEDNSCRVLAVKFLRIGHNDSNRVANRLKREATCWSLLKHTNINILQGFCVHPTNQLPGLVSDFCKFSLADYIGSPEYMSTKAIEKLSLLYEVSRGLDHMHHHKDKIAHGDVRPENILLVPRRFGTGYNALLSDFGVSYVDEELSAAELTSRQCTNYYYIAPELLSEECKTKKRMVSTPGDIYAFGCVFLRVMYDLRPFYQEPRHVLAMKRMSNLSLLPAAKKGIKNVHWDFLEKMWSLKPVSRPKADEVMIKIDAFKLSKE